MYTCEWLCALHVRTYTCVRHLFPHGIWKMTPNSCYPRERTRPEARKPNRSRAVIALLPRLLVLAESACVVGSTAAPCPATTVVAALLSPIRGGLLLLNAPKMLDLVQDAPNFAFEGEVDTAKLAPADLLVEKSGAITLPELQIQDLEQCRHRICPATAYHLMNAKGAVHGLVLKSLRRHAVRKEDRQVLVFLLKQYMIIKPYMIIKTLHQLNPT